MNPERLEPLILDFSPIKGSLWVYPWLGLLIGAGAGALVVTCPPKTDPHVKVREVDRREAER